MLDWLQQTFAGNASAGIATAPRFGHPDLAESLATVLHPAGRGRKRMERGPSTAAELNRAVLAAGGAGAGTLDAEGEERAAVAF